MVNLRSKSKAKVVEERSPLKIRIKIPTLPATPDSVDMSETALRKLSRAELQKLAMAHKVKANMKSETIIQQLSSLQKLKRTRTAEDVTEEGPSGKRLKNLSDASTPARENKVTGLDIPPVEEPSVETNARDMHLPEAGPSAPHSISPGHKTPTRLSYDEDLFSRTESVMTEEEQLDFATPVSSRSGTPPAANVIDLERCVQIMGEISAQDVTLINEVNEVRETAAKLRKRARDVRELVKAEAGRRERMEAFFRYWQETTPTWNRDWLSEEEKAPDCVSQPSQPEPAVAGREEPATPVAAQRPVLSPGEVRRRREEIIRKQEAEERQLQEEI